MRHIQRASVAAIINGFDDVAFDAHAIEARVWRLHAAGFARDILRYEASGDVAQTFSREFAKWVDRTFVGQIRQTRNVVSNN